MTRFTPTRRRAAICLPAVLIAMTVGPLAAEDPIHIRGMGGPFDNFIRQQTWAQRTVTVGNDTDADASLEVVYTGQEVAGAKHSYYRPFELPAGTIRRVSLAIRPGQLVETERTVGGLTGIEESYVLRRGDTGEQLSVNPDLTTLIEPEMTCIAILASEPVEHDQHKYLREMPGRELGQARLVRARVRDMPDRWYGYELIDVIMLGQTDLLALRQSQIDALLDWLRRGGVMVITAHDEIERMLAGPLGEIAGTTATGVHYATDLSVQEVGGEAADAMSVHLKRPYPIAELAPSDSDTLYLVNGLPLLTRKPCGQGWVFTLATPIGALKPGSLNRVWRTVAQAARVMPPLDDDRFAEPAQATLGQIAGRPGPTRAVPLAILAAVIAVTVILGGYLRLKRRGELLWVVLAPLAILVSLGVWVAGTLQTSEERMTYLGLVSGLTDDRARVQEMYVYYSGPSQRELTFTAGSQRGVIRDLSESATGGLGVRSTRCGAMMSLPDQEIQPNATAQFYVDAVEPAEGIGATLTFGPEGVVGELTNGLGADLEQTVMLAGLRTYAVGDVPAGGSTRVAVGPDDQLSVVRFGDPGTPRIAEGEFTPEADPRRNELIRRIVSRPDIRSRLRTGPVVIGRMSRSPLEPLGRRETVRAGWSEVVWPVKVTAPPSGEPVTIPAGFVAMEFVGTASGVWDPYARQFLASNTGKRVHLRVGPPEDVGALEDVNIRLAIGIRAVNFRLTVSGLTPDGEAVEFAEYANPTGVKDVAIEQADRFRRPGGGFDLILEVRPLATRPAGMNAQDTNQWQFDFLDVVLEGTVR